MDKFKTVLVLLFLFNLYSGFTQNNCLTRKDFKQYKSAIKLVTKDSLFLSFTEMTKASIKNIYVYDSIVSIELTDLYYDLYVNKLKIINYADTYHFLDSLTKIDANQLFENYFCSDLKKLSKNKQIKNITFLSKIFNNQFIVIISNSQNPFLTINDTFHLDRGLLFLFQINGNDIKIIHKLIIEYD